MFNIISEIKGPWSFVYFSNLNKRIYFGRDIFGRHSLLWSHRDSLPGDGAGPNCLLNGVACCSLQESDATTQQCHHETPSWKPFQFTLVSVGKCEDNLQEVPAYGIYFIDLNNLFQDKIERDIIGQRLVINLIPWNLIPTLNTHHLQLVVHTKTLASPIKIALNTSQPDEQILSKLRDISDNYHCLSSLAAAYEYNEDISTLRHLLTEAVDRRVQACPACCGRCTHTRHCRHSRVAVLFSGGLDSAVLAALLEHVLPRNETIDLINVAFPVRSVQTINKEKMVTKHCKRLKENTKPNCSQ